eukprot:74567_1
MEQWLETNMALMKEVVRCCECCWSPREYIIKYSTNKIISAWPVHENVGLFLLYKPKLSSLFVAPANAQPESVPELQYPHHYLYEILLYYRYTSNIVNIYMCIYFHEYY